LDLITFQNGLNPDRPLRILRPIIAISRKPELQRMTSLLVSGVPDLIRMVMIMGVCVIYFMLLGNEMFSREIPERFGDLGTSMYTVYLCMVSGSFQVMIYNESVQNPETAVYTPFFFLMLTIIGSLLLVKLLVGIATRGFQLASGASVKHDSEVFNRGVLFSFEILTGCDSRSHADYVISHDVCRKVVQFAHKQTKYGEDLAEKLVAAVAKPGSNCFDVKEFEQFALLMEIGWVSQKDPVFYPSYMRQFIQYYLQVGIEIPIPKFLKTKPAKQVEVSGIYFQHSKYQVDLASARKAEKEEKAKAKRASEVGIKKKSKKWRITYSELVVGIMVIAAAVNVFHIAEILNEGEASAPWYQYGLSWVVFVFFAFEAVIKIYAYGLSDYWSSNWHKLDLLCLLGNLVDIFYTLDPQYEILGNALLAIRGLRLLKLLDMFEPFAIMMGTISLTVSAVSPFIFLYFSFVYIYAILGYIWFGDVIITTTENPALVGGPWYNSLRFCINFDDFGGSILAMFLYGVNGAWWRLLEVIDAVYPENVIPGRFFFISYRMLSFLVFLPCFFGFVLQVWGTCTPIATKLYQSNLEEIQRVLDQGPPTRGPRDDDEESGLLTEQVSPRRLMSSHGAHEKAVIAETLSQKSSSLKKVHLQNMRNTEYIPHARVKVSKVMKIGYQTVLDTVAAQEKFEIEEKLADAKLMRAFLQDLLIKRRQHASTRQ
jgi:hypothetical protein